MKTLNGGVKLFFFESHLSLLLYCDTEYYFHRKSVEYNGKYSGVKQTWVQVLNAAFGSMFLSLLCVFYGLSESQLQNNCDKTHFVVLL